MINLTHADHLTERARTRPPVVRQALEGSNLTHERTIADCPACNYPWPGRTAQDGTDLIVEHMNQLLTERDRATKSTTNQHITRDGLT